MSRLLVAVSVLALACGPTPEITEVAPTPAERGQAVTVRGTALPAEAQVVLDGEPGRFALPVELASTEAHTVRIPHETPVGSYRLELVAGRTVVSGPAVEVLPVDPERPCTEEYRADNAISLARDTVTLARTWRDDTTETIELDLDAIAAVELRAVPLEDGRTCSAVLLVLEDGSSRLYADDAAVVLGGFAKRLADELGVELRTP